MIYNRYGVIYTFARPLQVSVILKRLAGVASLHQCLQIPRRCRSTELTKAKARIIPLSPNQYATSYAYRFWNSTVTQNPLVKLLPNLVSTMRLLESNTNGEFSLTEHLGDSKPQYAILSHRWETEEVTFKDLIDGTSEAKVGYKKIRFCANQASKDGLRYIWVDSCCIDKSSSAEVGEAINSMFRWYQYAARCYVFLSDVSNGEFPSNGPPDRPWLPAFKLSRWFTRAWTLQDLLAPSSVEFFTTEGERLGDKSSLSEEISDITGIPGEALQGVPLSQFTVEERMRWAKTRQATREEDRIYSLLGIFDISMPLLYGEGERKALMRLRREISAQSERKNISLTSEMPDYSPLNDSDFRILTLNAGMEGDVIDTHISKFNLQRPPAYNALSYVWGHEPAIHRILVGQKTVRIRPNLFHAMQRIRSETDPMYIWVDSLCINQSDGPERNAQVRRMADIYRKARNVFIWLGEADFTSDIAMDFIPRIPRHDFEWGERWWEEQYVTALDHILGDPGFSGAGCSKKLRFRRTRSYFAAPAKFA